MKAILMDMDGTLLPMSQEDFTRGYFRELLAYCAPLGLEPERMKEMLWASIKAMVKNDGTVTNATRFNAVFLEYFPGKEQVLPRIADFYTSTYARVGADVQPQADIARAVKILKSKGYRLVVATNPFFPEEAQWRRLGWAGLDADDFEWITHYENAHFCKPNPAYYTELLQALGLEASECVMIGNDVEEDMEAAALAGIAGWLLTDYVINRKERDLARYPHGTAADWLAWAEALPAV